MLEVFEMEREYGKGLYLTKKINAKLEELKEANGVHKEGLGNILLLLAMADDNMVKQALNIIKIWDIKGGVDIEKIENRG
jgi:hypothetical protein